jgi:hypothetical protein
MSCCGKKRELLRGHSWAAAQAPSQGQSVVYFRYEGGQLLTLVGAATKRVYRFAGPGATVAADPRDAPALAAVARLMQVARP